MIDESKYEMRTFIQNQISNLNIHVDDAKIEQIIEQINAAITDASQHSDWEVKNDVQEQLNIRLQSILDKYQLPFADKVFDEILARTKSSTDKQKSFWFVGASFDKSREDQTERFLKDGIWQNGNQDKYLDKVRNMQPGDKIAIKSTYKRKKDLPFDNKDEPVPVMGIKAIGVITHNHNDGQFVDVEWQPRFEPVKEWYYSINLDTVWHVLPNYWKKKALIDFTFNNQPQDIDRFRNDTKLKDEESMNDDKPSTEENEVATVPIAPYTIDDIIAEGCFLDRASIIRIIERLKHKKNLILQGPPGTGKTWLAKKLAYALMGQKDESSLRAVQFHPNLSYEDFVRGWRPSGEGKLTLVDGPFLEMIHKAKNDESNKYVIVIEEINRGNPAQIFGEMLTLLEADKRTSSEALELSYHQTEGEKIYIPTNLYVIGTMNIADRSLALVDLALRRRFAFFDLKPTLGQIWRDWVNSKTGIKIEFLEIIEQRIDALNNEIANDSNLGSQFKIGHSYVTPPLNTKIEDASAWFQDVVEFEIGPLLEEYWFDNIELANESQKKLIEGI